MPLPENFGLHLVSIARSMSATFPKRHGVSSSLRGPQFGSQTIRRNALNPFEQVEVDFEKGSAMACCRDPLVTRAGAFYDGTGCTAEIPSPPRMT